MRFKLKKKKVEKKADKPKIKKIKKKKERVCGRDPNTGWVCILPAGHRDNGVYGHMREPVYSSKLENLTRAETSIAMARQFLRLGEEHSFSKSLLKVHEDLKKLIQKAQVEDFMRRQRVLEAKRKSELEEKTKPKKQLVWNAKK